MTLVVIDPGHGGRDPGTVGNGLQEKMITLAAAIHLRDALQRCGIQVIMTRTTDSLVLPNGTVSQDLSARAEIANRNKADLFISWHVDSFSNPDVHGISVWIYPSTRGTETERAAQTIVNSVAQATGQTNRRVFVADFAVLRETGMTAVLVESGFLTNPEEANRLASEAFRRIQAEAAARAICEYFNLPYVGPTQPSPSPTPPPQPTPPAPVPEEPFPGEELPEWARSAILQVYQTGVMTGYENGTFRAENPVTRAELAVALVRLYDLIRKGRTM